MGNVSGHVPVKLIAGLISGDAKRFEDAKCFLEKKFGKVERESGIFDFSCTDYYEDEFGQNLKRKLLSFTRLISLRKSYRIKLYTNRIEKKLSSGNKRTVNIDPGYITLSNLVLFTTKGRSHRIYIDEGIYGDLELCFVKKSFRPLEWTYPDYRKDEYIKFFNIVREGYTVAIKRGK